MFTNIPDSQVLLKPEHPLAPRVLQRLGALVILSASNRILGGGGKLGEVWNDDRGNFKVAWTSFKTDKIQRIKVQKP